MKKRKLDPPRQPANGKRDGGLVAVELPFSNVDPDKIREALAAMGQQQAEEFPQLLDKLRTILARYYPPHYLSVIATYGLQVAVSKAGVANKSMVPGVQQFHVELLHAFVLMMPRSRWSMDPASPQDIEEIIALVSKLGASFHQRRLVALHEDRDLQNRTVLSLQEAMRLHTQAVRNWGYFEDVIAIVKELYGSFDDVFKSRLGFSAIELIAVSRQLVSLVEARSNERLRLLRHIFREREKGRLIRRYFAEYLSGKSDVENFIRHMPPTASRNEIIARLRIDADFDLPATYFFRAEDLSVDLKMTPETIASVLRSLAAIPGALERNDPEHFFLNNPVWTLPVVDLDDGFYCPTPQSIFSHIHDVMHMLVERVGVAKLLERRRAEYLETKVHSLLGKSLQGAELRHGTKWSIGGVEYETDHLALLDKTVIIVEDKSAKLSSAGLRGAPERVKRHVRELILEPTEQSTRLANIIELAAANDAAAKVALEPFGLDFSKVERFVQISVTLDLLPELPAIDKLGPSVGDGRCGAAGSLSNRSSQSWPSMRPGLRRRSCAGSTASATRPSTIGRPSLAA